MIPRTLVFHGCIAIALCSGCNNGLHDIDARTDRLVRERSALLGHDAAPPNPRTGDDSSGAGDSRLTRKDLPTTNPDAADLRYTPRPTSADEAADVEHRLSGLDAPDEGATLLDLQGALRQSQLTAREYLSAEEEYILAAIRLLSEHHLWGPRLFNDSSFTYSNSQSSGVTSTAATIVNELRATQRLPYGGEAAVHWIVNATENLKEVATDRYVQSSRLVLDASIPLMRGAGDIAQESLIQAERSLIYSARDFEAFRRRFLVDIAKDYFALIQQRQAIDNSTKQLDALKHEESRKQALYDAGRVAQTELNITHSDVLSTTSGLASARESYILALDRFKIRLGYSVDARIALRPIQIGELDIPLPETTLAAAVENALSYRLDLQNRRDQLDDAQRGVKNARSRLLPDATLSGSLALPTDPGKQIGGLAFDDGDMAFSTTLTFSLPLDREIERLDLRSSLIRFAQSKRDFDKFRDDLVVTVRSQVRQIDRAKFSLLLAEEGVKTNERRKLEQSLKPAEVTSQQILETENSLLAARNNRDQAVTDLRNAVLDYLVDTGLMRVGRDGTLIRLPGMEPQGPPPAPPSPDAAPPPTP